MVLRKTCNNDKNQVHFNGQNLFFFRFRFPSLQYAFFFLSFSIVNFVFRVSIYTPFMVCVCVFQNFVLWRSKNTKTKQISTKNPSNIYNVCIFKFYFFFVFSFLYFQWNTNYIYVCVVYVAVHIIFFFFSFSSFYLRLIFEVHTQHRYTKLYVQYPEKVKKTEENKTRNTICDAIVCKCVLACACVCEWGYV